MAIATTPASAQAQSLWVPSWTAAQEPLNAATALSPSQLTDATLRQAVRLSIGGDKIRVVLSNMASRQPLTISGVHVALSATPGAAAIEVPSDHKVLFARRPEVVVAPGGSATSDALDFPVAPLARLSVSIHFDRPPVQQTGHRRSRSTSWLARGDQLAAPTLVGATPVEHWYQITQVQVQQPGAHAIVAFGDSITDGSGSLPDRNERWPDLLAERLLADVPGQRWAVVNEGLAGNRVLTDGVGPSGLSRFGRDALEIPHARTVVLMEGINDLGQLTQAGSKSPAEHQALVHDMIAAYGRLVSEAHAHGLKIVGATLMPDSGSDYHPTLEDDADRRALNAWIREPGHFDSVIDWDRIMRDPAAPQRLKPAYDSGDHIHPSAAGHRAMVDAISIPDLLH